LEDAKWNTGSGSKKAFNDILREVKEHSKNNGTVYIRTDSFFRKDHCIFSNAICLYGANGQQGGRYFFRRIKIDKKQFPSLSIRMIKEAEQTISLAQNISENIPDVKLELHLDISNTEKGEGTSYLASMLIGYVQGSGFECKIKPDAFAAASIADKHSK
jgi:predicted RNase H-related nuclease YkuK (DUF458 family)